MTGAVVHIAQPVTTLNSDLTLCRKYLGETDWICFEGDGNYSAANCEQCVSEANRRRTVSAMARDKIAEMRGKA